MARVFPRIMLAFALAVVPLTVQTGDPASATSQVTCQGGFRAWDRNITSEARGVSGIFRLPPAGAVSVQQGTNQASAADVYLIQNPNGPDFVQIGWYVGRASQLPFTSTPRVFFGEYYASDPYGEVLQAGANLSWGSYHVFKLLYSTSSLKYYFYVDGVYIGQSILSHMEKGLPGAIGEANHPASAACIQMWGEAHRGSPNPDYKSLIYLKFTPTATCHYFNDNYDAIPPYSAFKFMNTQATAWLVGPCDPTCT